MDDPLNVESAAGFTGLRGSFDDAWMRIVLNQAFGNEG
jgi:hypothetical protein